MTRDSPAAGAQPSTWYRYASSSPGSNVDPSGLVDCKCNPPGVLGAIPKDPAYPCYVRVCRVSSAGCEAYGDMEGSMCGQGHIAMCTVINVMLGERPENARRTLYCHAHAVDYAGGLGDFSACCNQCGLRVCCHITCPGMTGLDGWTRAELARCAGHGHPVPAPPR